jgi:tetrahydromethanopterin S-methyltransferase subunit H
MSFKEMASKREKEAEVLEDSEIWMAIVSKFVLMEFDLNNRAEMLMQAVGGDKEIIRKALSECVKHELVTEDQADEMLTAIS